ncbi:TVP38/TMEM64 family protein [Paenibacillus sp. YYML68]|uniref:TVP38/TMEM64 family protein n=1 Tax=Paenibacillus sp. YYML68 TaxID=2909250 RepID=UPI002490B329|nr:TVP38/TMEM64 family protein [Paenibacillus sp. YYML68]
MIKKIGMIVVYVVASYFIFKHGDVLLGWLQQSDRLLLVALFATLLALFPIIPYPVVGSVIGAAFGPMLGGLLTWVGSAAASVLMFLFVRYGYQDWGRRLLQRYHRLDRVTAWFERNAFLAIVFSRLLPFIPSIIINVYAALSRVSWLTYTIASSLGKIPAMLLFAFVGDSVVTEPRQLLVVIAVYGVFLAVLLLGYRLWTRSRT